MKNEKSKTKNLSIVLFQIFSMILSIISFSFILGGMIIGVANLTSAVDTTPFIPKGCCLESNDGSKIYTLADKISGKKLNFAVKTCIMPAGI